LYLRDFVNVEKEEFVEYFFRCLMCGLECCEDAEFAMNGENQIGISLERVRDEEVILPSFVDYLYGSTSSSIKCLDLVNVTNMPEGYYERSLAIRKICGSKVLTCEDACFNLCYNLVSVDFPCLMSIGDSSFNSCSRLTEINLPNVESVGDYAFCSCEGLIEVDFPNLRAIGEGSFCRCMKLKTVNFPNVVSIDDYAFQHTAISNFRGEKVLTIGDAVFRLSFLHVLDVPNCKKLMDVGLDRKILLLRVGKDCTAYLNDSVVYYSLSQYEKYAKAYPEMSENEILNLLKKDKKNFQFS
jgi:hypothetical protein